MNNDINYFQNIKSSNNSNNNNNIDNNFNSFFNNKEIIDSNALTKTSNRNINNINIKEINNSQDSIETNSNNNIIINNTENKSNNNNNKINSQDLYLSFESPTIILIKIVDNCYFEGHLHLKNNVNKYLVYKFKTDFPSNISITPVFSFIPPMESIIINIKAFVKNEIELKINDILITLITSITNKKIEDVNDAKIYLKREEMYSPDNQIYNFNLIFDNGYNPKTFLKIKNERINIIKKFESQININNLTNINEVEYYINKVKNEINVYKDKIEKLKPELNFMNEDNIVSNPDVIFDKETFYKFNNELNNNNENDKNYISISFLLFSMCISLFIGKFIKILIK